MQPSLQLFGKTCTDFHVQMLPCARQLSCNGLHLNNIVHLTYFQEDKNNCMHNFIFLPSWNREVILSLPSPTWMRKNNYLYIIIKLSLLCGWYLRYVKWLFWCTRWNGKAIVHLDSPRVRQAFTAVRSLNTKLDCLYSDIWVLMSCGCEAWQRDIFSLSF